MLFDAYLICLRCTRGSTIRGQSVRGSSPGWKDTFSIDDKGGEIYQMQRTEAWFQGSRFIRCRGQRHGSRGSMSDMISVLHQSVAINAKGGDC
jgi:hypothetical protein